MPREEPDPDRSPARKQWGRRDSPRAERARALAKAEGLEFQEEAYTWKSFEPNNTAARRHGALQKSVHLEPMVQEIVAGVLADRPDLVAYPEALLDWADSECRCALLRSYLAQHSMFNERGKLRDSVLKYLAVFSRRSEAGRIRLGLDPPSAAELVSQNVNAEQSVERLREMGRKALDANRDLDASKDDDDE